MAPSTGQEDRQDPQRIQGGSVVMYVPERVAELAKYFTEKGNPTTIHTYRPTCLRLFDLFQEGVNLIELK